MLNPVLSRRMFAASAAIAALLIVGSAGQVAAQNSMSSHTMDMREEVAPENLPPPQKLAGIGNAHIRITSSPEAQMWFDQGLNLLHDFWDYESVRAFEQSVRVDPNCAMCYWGIHQAEKFRHSNAKYYSNQALARAVFTSKRAPPPKLPRILKERKRARESPRKCNSIEGW
jgi:hypothetical protein